MKYQSTANTTKGLVRGLITKLLNDSKSGKVYTANELEIIFSEALRRLNELDDEGKLNQIEILDGWKGKGTIQVYQGFTNDFKIIEHIKDKHSHKVTQKHSVVRKEDMNRILCIIKKIPLETPHKCYYFAEKLGYPDWKSLWKERK